MTTEILALLDEVERVLDHGRGWCSRGPSARDTETGADQLCLVWAIDQAWAQLYRYQPLTTGAAFYALHRRLRDVVKQEFNFTSLPEFNDDLTTNWLEVEVVLEKTRAKLEEEV